MKLGNMVGYRVRTILRDSIQDRVSQYVWVKVYWTVYMRVAATPGWLTSRTMARLGN